MQYRRISADCHLDLPRLPRDLFVSEARRELMGRVPFVPFAPHPPVAGRRAPPSPRWRGARGLCGLLPRPACGERVGVRGPLGDP
jgi:hypothetical protein